MQVVTVDRDVDRLTDRNRATRIEPPDRGRIAEIVDRNDAEALRGTELTVSRDALPELGDDEFYYADLIGLECRAPDGSIIGEVIAIEDFGAGDVIEIKPMDGKAFMVPSSAVEIEAERVVIDPDFLA